MKISVFVSLYFCALTAGHAQNLLADDIQLTQGGLAGFEKYKGQKGKKAFAVGDNGAWGMGYGYQDDSAAIRTALSNCQRNSKYNCKLFDKDDEAWQGKYQQFLKESEAAIQNLKIQDGYQIYEDADWLLPPVTQLRLGREGFHYATPRTIEGIKNISTPELAGKLAKKQITVIDSLGVDNSSQTLPFAYSLDGAANLFADNQQNLNQVLDEDLRAVMSKAFPEKDTPIAVFCVSAECWVSVNTLLRLKNLGYSNLYWYRGGIFAWQSAKLPMVKPVPMATVLR